MEEILNRNLNHLAKKKKFVNPSRKNERTGEIVAIVLGGIIGFVNGLFGAGGGMLVVPVLSTILGYTTKKAHATAILIILPLCLVSGVVYLVRGVSDGGVFLPTILGVVFGGILGAYALKKCSNVALQFIFYGVMLVAGIKMLF